DFQTFTGIAVFCTLFGLLVLAILKPLKRLTHGAEDLDLSLENGVANPKNVTGKGALQVKTHE
ncbi:MAG: hypothetical protein C7N36_19370, partial [Bacteroidetes bacterium]